MELSFRFQYYINIRFDNVKFCNFVVAVRKLIVKIANSYLNTFQQFNVLVEVFWRN